MRLTRLVGLALALLARCRRAVPGAAVLAAVVLGALAFVRGGEATDFYMAPGYFAGGLTSASSWEEILPKNVITRLVIGDFPHIGFGVRFVPLNLTCLAEGRLRPLDSSFPGEGPTAREGGRYAVGVFKVLPNSTNPARVFLFTKTFDVPACPPR